MLKLTHQKNNVLDTNNQIHTNSFVNAEKTFVPIARREFINKIILQSRESTTLERVKVQELQTLIEILQTIYHARFHRHYISLKNTYAPFNPDRDVVSKRNWSDEEKSCLQGKLFREISALLQKANYEELDETSINIALNDDMSRGLSIGVELDDYQQVLIYNRGHGLIKTKKRKWRTLFLKEYDHEIAIYRRLTMVFRFRGVEQLSELLDQKGLNRFNKWLYLRRHERLMQDQNSDKFIFMSQFRDIPCSDLEMLFPNSTLRFTLLDKIKLAATGGAGTVGGIMALLSKIALAVKPLTILIAIISFGTVLGRQVTNVLHQQNHYKMVLSRSLFSHSLDINLGVVASLLDQALDEEVKEAILAYYILIQSPTEFLSADQIKIKVENFVQVHFKVDINFEVSDAIIKLRKDGLLIKNTKGYQAIEPQAACTNLEAHWHDLYASTQKLAEVSYYTDVEGAKKKPAE